MLLKKGEGKGFLFFGGEALMREVGEVVEELCGKGGVLEMEGIRLGLKTVVDGG